MVLGNFPTSLDTSLTLPRLLDILLFDINEWKMGTTPSSNEVMVAALLKYCVKSPLSVHLSVIKNTDIERRIKITYR